ncbi:MAG: lysophospholipid acyltransferase family protein [Thermoanaerobaculia bacterium]
MKPLEQTLADRWLRRGIIGALGLGFSIPYLRLLNTIRATGDEILESLPEQNVVFLSNHQTYFLEAIAFFDLLYVRHGFPLEHPLLRFSAAEETMKKNLMTSIFTKAGGVTFRRSFREGGVEVMRPVDLDGVARVERAIAAGWLLHFPAGTTQKGAPIRAGVAQLLHRTKAIAVPLRVDGFRKLLLHKQLPGRLFQRCSLTFHPPLELTDFYAKPYQKDEGRKVVETLTALIGDPRDENDPKEAEPG